MMCETADDDGTETPGIEPTHADPIRVFLVEDRSPAMQSLVDDLRRQPGVRVAGVSDSGLLACVRALFEPAEVIVISADIVGFSAFDTSRLAKQMCPQATVLMLGRCAESLRCLRRTERPDAVIERPCAPGEVAALIRWLGAQARALAHSGAATQYKRGPDGGNSQSSQSKP